MGSISHYITPPVICHSFYTSKMTGTHQEQLIDILRVLLFFMELTLFLYVFFFIFYSFFFQKQVKVLHEAKYTEKE